jgi:hypothetical protein
MVTKSQKVRITADFFELIKIFDVNIRQINVILITLGLAHLFGTGLVFAFATAITNAFALMR